MRAFLRSSRLPIGVAMIGSALVAGCSTGTPVAGPTVTVTATSTGSASASPSSAPATTTPAGPGPCQSSELKVTLGPGNGAAGSAIYEILFTNDSSTTCTLYGFPGVSFTGETSAVQVGPAATRNHTIQPRLVTLAPGAVGSAAISVVDAQNYLPGPCGLTTASGILVYPPNLTTSVGLPFNGYTCVHPKDHVLSVDPVVAGSGSG
jgi:ABC-type transport system substrate-binding protein